MWVYLTIAMVTVVAFAWFAVVLVSARLRQTPELTFLDIEAATEFVAENLPEEITMRLSHDDVRLLIRWELTYLRKRGIASYGDVDSVAEAAARNTEAVIADEDELVDELVRRSAKNQMNLQVIDIVCVTDLVNEYMRGIGVIGEQVHKVEDD